LAGLKTGSVAPEVFAHAEAKRARNALVYRWTKDPRLPGQTVDLGADEATFAGAVRGFGVDVDALFPALADWLRWRWLRHQKDRTDEGRWRRAVKHDLPCRIEAAAAAVRWADLGGQDKRTCAGRALKAALRAGGQPDRAVAPVRGPAALSPLPVQPWTARTTAEGWKRRLPDQVKPKPGPPEPPRSVGRPRAVPDTPDELEAWAGLLRGVEPQVRAMFDTIARQEDRLRFLRDLAEYARAPNDAGARTRWMWWVMTKRQI